MLKKLYLWVLKKLSRRVLPVKVISGGQTGADFAGLVTACYMGLQTGGTAPKGWRIKLKDGSDSSDPSLAAYGLVEHKSREYEPRTIQNVKDADGTVWFGYVESPGGQLTRSTAEIYDKPFIVNPSPEDLMIWVYQNKITVLNVAGNAESSFNPDIFETTVDTLRRAFKLNKGN